MGSAVQFSLEMLVLVQRELLLFVAAFVTLGAIDELLVDVIYLRVRLSRRHQQALCQSDAELLAQPLSGKVAVFVPAWQEAAVIEATMRYALAVWPHAELTLYVGCYRNDFATIAAATTGARGDYRARIVIHDAMGPTTKSDCLNRLWQALVEDERRSDSETVMVLMQDAEDMVDPAAVALCDRALAEADLIQLPVVALPLRQSRWVASHYSDEFAEAHGKTLVVRDALGAAIPGAGVGCAIAKPMLARLAEGRAGPFAPLALTEDYELGLNVARMGGRTRFLRFRAQDGRLVATRAYFPERLETSIRQKTRWVHGIALQGWDRLGWSGRLASTWMEMRDRKGPFAALILALGYVLVLLTAILWSADAAGLVEPPEVSPVLTAILLANLGAFLVRMLARSLFTASEHGWREGLRAAPRLFLGNVIAILAGRRAFAAYLGTLAGAAPVWDKTEHRDHPAIALRSGAPA